MLIDTKQLHAVCVWHVSGDSVGGEGAWMRGGSGGRVGPVCIVVIVVLPCPVLQFSTTPHHTPCACPHTLTHSQDDNAIVRTFGSPRTEEKLYNHVDLVQLLVGFVVVDVVVG